MRVYIEKESHHGELTKKPPTTFCQLVEEKLYYDEDYGEILDKEHYASEWYIKDVGDYNLGSLLLGLQSHENELISFRYSKSDKVYRVWIEDEDAEWG